MRLQQLARDLWPYLQPLIEPMLRRSGSSSSGGVVGGAPSPHALNSTTHHSGTLADSQGPQFLMRDGSRSLVGNLAVAAGITVDGVDLSAHAADPAAHHALATAGNTGISVSGQAISLFLNATASGLEISSGLRLADGIAGNGLIIASKILAVGAGDGIDVNANDVAVDVTDIIDTAAGLQEDASNNIQIKRHTDSGLAFGLSGGLTLGTPTTLTINTTNSVSGVSHAHAIDASSDVGTTPAEKILKSTPSGGLTLANLDVRGNLDVVNGGDLTVGANILFVDASLASIGVNRAPDPQFDLDVAGNLRAAYIVGKHAIQLEDALLICHYDTREPFGVNHFGDLHGHAGQIANPRGGIAVVPGKFYSSLSVGSANTNYIVNPRFENNVTDGWTRVEGGGSISRSTSRSFLGQATARMVYGSSEAYMEDAITAVATGERITISCWVWRTFGTGDVVLSLYNNTTASIQSSVTTTTGVYGEWEELIVSYVNPDPSRNFRFRVRLTGSDTVYVAACQKVKGPPVPYLDGAMGGYNTSGKPDGTGYTWSGTAHNSSSTRVAARVSYDGTNCVNGQRGTAMMWARVPWGDMPTVVDATRFFSVGSGGTDVLYLRKVGSSGQLRVGIAGADSAITYNSFAWDTEWHHFAVTWDGVENESNLYIDGVLVATGTAGFFTPSTIYVGSSSDPAYQLDGYIDDFVITSRVQTAGRIRSIYESDAPVFAESAVFHFRATPKGLVWADDEGLWMRNSAGDEVLGAYGGSSTKSWSGLTLAPGDIVFGDSNRGAYLWWDDSAGTLILGKTGASTSNLYLDGGSVKMRANATERFSLSSAGVMEIKDSGGAAVFSFDASAGAEFTKPLTLGANGGIYQGTGSFASPTTGLKIWRDSSIGRIAGYNGGTVQWYANTDGKLYAGGGNVVLDASGIQVSQTGGTGAYARLYPASGLVIGSKDTTVIDYSSSAMPGTFSFGGITIDHLTSLGYANLDFGYATGVQQARLGVYGENTAIDSELLLSSVAKNPAGTSAAAESRIVLKATSWGNQPFSYEARLELDALLRRLWAVGDLRVSGSVHVDGDGGGVSGTVGLTDQSNTSANSTGTGSVKMKGGTSRDSVGFIKLYNGTTAIWIPYWTTITG